MRSESAPPRRHPEHGGYARGEETRARIVAAAIAAFGEEGYEQASTRRIAARAGVNAPALQYYFDSKEGLHRACAEYIIERVSAILAPALERAASAVRGAGRGAADREEALDSLCALLEAVADGLVAAGSENWSQFIARGRAEGAGPAMALIHEQIGAPLLDATAELVAIATRCPVRSEVTRLRACTVLGQVSALCANREKTLAIMGWSQFDERGLALIKAVVREHTRAALRGVGIGRGRVRGRASSRESGQAVRHRADEELGRG